MVVHASLQWSTLLLYFTLFLSTSAAPSASIGDATPSLLRPRSPAPQSPGFSAPVAPSTPPAPGTQWQLVQQESNFEEYLYDYATPGLPVQPGTTFLFAIQAAGGPITEIQPAFSWLDTFGMEQVVPGPLVKMEPNTSQFEMGFTVPLINEQGLLCTVYVGMPELDTTGSFQIYQQV